MAAAHPVAHASAANVEHAIVRVMNQNRHRHGLPGLHFSPRLTFIAGVHSKDLLSHDRLSHTSTNGTSFTRRLRRVTRARSIGETIAEVRGQLSAHMVVRLWLRSPAHRRELLSHSFRRVGVGFARRGRASVVTADFASAR